MSISELKVQVRDNGDYLEAFWKDGSETGCFSFKEGHNVCSEGYRLKTCKPVAEKVAISFITEMQAYYDSCGGDRVSLVLVSKLRSYCGG